MELGVRGVQPMRGPVKKQAELLKYITSLHTQEELLLYVMGCHHQLDTINLVTVLYRLARIHNNTHTAEQRAVARERLLESNAFQMLLNAIHTHLLQAQAAISNQSSETAQLKPTSTGGNPVSSGPNAQCISNLMWSLDKLEVMSVESRTVVTAGVTAETASSVLAWEVAMAAAPLVEHRLAEFTSQGLGNLLWNFARMPAPPPSVLVAIMMQSVKLLEVLTPADVPDVQALSHSLRSIAHIRTRSTKVDSLPAWQKAVTRFLLPAAHHCIRALAVEGVDAHDTTTTTSIIHGRQAASVKTIVSIAFSYSVVLGPACVVQAPVSTLFLIIRKHVLARLQSDLTGSPASHVVLGSMNEQSLSRVVQAFDAAHLLTAELLQAVLDVAGLRLRRAAVGTQDTTLGYRPEELCVLLRACHEPGIQPWFFLHALSKRLAGQRDAIRGWSAAELLDLQRALQLQLDHVATASQGQVTQVTQNHATQSTCGHVAPSSMQHRGAAVPQLDHVTHVTEGNNAMYSSMQRSAAVPQMPQVYYSAAAGLLDKTGSVSLPASKPRPTPFPTRVNSFISLPTAATAPQALRSGMLTPPPPAHALASSHWHQRPGPVPQAQPSLLLPVANRYGQVLDMGANSHPLDMGAYTHALDMAAYTHALGIGAYSHTLNMAAPMLTGYGQAAAGVSDLGAGSDTGGPGLATNVQAHQQRHLGVADPGDTRFMQQAWVVDGAGHLQPFTFAGAQAEQTASVLQYLLRAPHAGPGGYLP